MTTYRLMDGVSGRPGAGSSGTQPPSAGTSYGGNYSVGLLFQVTVGSLWLEGYWWWVPATVSDTAAIECALWQITGSEIGTFVSGGTVTSGTLTAGQWNWVPLATPVMLAAGMVYEAVMATTLSHGFPVTVSQFGSGDPYAAGITNGPLQAFSSVTGSFPVLSAGHAGPGWSYQQPYSISITDPTASFPTGNDSDALLWLDVQVTDQAPPGVWSYRFLPNAPGGFSGSINEGAYTLGLEFYVTQPCALSKIWQYSVTGSVALPTRCGIWVVSSQTELAGSDNSSPSWKKMADGSAASAGDGWVYCDYSGAGVTLAANTNYKVSTFLGVETSDWFGAVPNLFGAGDFYQSGITNGPLVILSDAAASPGQDSWNPITTWAYPDTSSNPEYDGPDVEVTPVSLALPAPTVTAGGRMSARLTEAYRFAR